LRKIIPFPNYRCHKVASYLEHMKYVYLAFYVYIRNRFKKAYFINMLDRKFNHDFSYRIVMRNTGPVKEETGSITYCVLSCGE